MKFLTDSTHPQCWRGAAAAAAATEKLTAAATTSTSAECSAGRQAFYCCQGCRLYSILCFVLSFAAFVAFLHKFFCLFRCPCVAQTTTEKVPYNFNSAKVIECRVAVSVVIVFGAFYRFISSAAIVCVAVARKLVVASLPFADWLAIYILWAAEKKKEKRNG